LSGKKRPLQLGGEPRVRRRPKKCVARSRCIRMCVRKECVDDFFSSLQRRQTFFSVLEFFFLF
jgi:hypothetical protein